MSTVVRITVGVGKSGNLYVHKCINNIFYFHEKHLLVQSGMVIIILREK